MWRLGGLFSVDKDLASSPEMAMQEFLACSHTCGWGEEIGIYHQVTNMCATKQFKEVSKTYLTNTKSQLC